MHIIDYSFAPIIRSLTQMKKALIVLLVSFFAVSGLFAAWNAERDETLAMERGVGDAEITTVLDGTATDASGQTSETKVNVIQYLFGYDFPVTAWDFFIYLNDSEVEYEEETDTAVVTVRDASGKVTTFNTANKDYGTYWNKILQIDAVAFTELALENEKLDVEIAIKGAKYAFTLDLTGYAEIFHEMYDPMLYEFPDDWHKFEYNEEAKAIQLEIKQLYEEYGIESTQAEYFFEYKDTFWCAGEEFLICIDMSSEDMYYNSYPYLDIDITKIERSKNLTYMEFGDAFYYEDSLLALEFVVDDTYYVMQDPDKWSIWTLAENADRVFTAMKNAQKTSIVFVFNQTGVIRYEIDGKKFAEYYEKAKAIPQIIPQC